MQVKKTGTETTRILFIMKRRKKNGSERGNKIAAKKLLLVEEQERRTRMSDALDDAKKDVSSLMEPKMLSFFLRVRPYA